MNKDKQQKMVLILDNIRSVHNVGSIFRTAETAGISKLFLVGTTPTPVDRFGRSRPDLAKVALGAEKNVPWGHCLDSSILIKELKHRGFKILALEQAENSVDYKKVKLSENNALILGNEVEGIHSSTLRLADLICEIPMKGKKESLNVSVSAGIAIFRLLGI